MEPIAWSDVVTVAPELASVPSSAQALYLAHANNALDVGAFGDVSAARLATIYLAAHVATSSSIAAGGKGAVASETLGGMSRSYAAPVVTGSDFESTGYGRMFSALVRSAPARAWAVL